MKQTWPCNVCAHGHKVLPASHHQLWIIQHFLPATCQRFQRLSAMPWISVWSFPPGPWGSSGPLTSRVLLGQTCNTCMGSYPGYIHQPSPKIQEHDTYRHAAWQYYGSVFVVQVFCIFCARSVNLNVVYIFANLWHSTALFTMGLNLVLHDTDSANQSVGIVFLAIDWLLCSWSILLLGTSQGEAVHLVLSQVCVPPQCTVFHMTRMPPQTPLFKASDELKKWLTIQDKVKLLVMIKEGQSYTTLACH